MESMRDALKDAKLISEVDIQKYEKEKRVTKDLKRSLSWFCPNPQYFYAFKKYFLSLEETKRISLLATITKGRSSKHICSVCKREGVHVGSFLHMPLRCPDFTLLLELYRDPTLLKKPMKKIKKDKVLMYCDFNICFECMPPNHIIQYFKEVVK